MTGILADHWNIDSGLSTSTDFSPFLLFFPKVHHLVLRFFLRMWNESGAATTDFGRVSALVRSQVSEVLRNENTKSWYEAERDFLDSEYRTVRDRQMKELEVEDDYNSKASIRNLRGRLYRESYEFVRQQRIHCLLEGAWFRNPSASRYGGAKRTGNSAGNGTSTQTGSTKPFRFYRLSPNKKYLHYCESMDQGAVRGGLDDLPERIDLSLVTDVSLQSGSGESSSLTFSLLRAPDVSLADLQALNQSQYSEWVDGLNMLRGEGGVVSTRETAEYIQILTEIGVKVKLLDLTGERVSFLFQGMTRKEARMLTSYACQLPIRLTSPLRSQLHQFQRRPSSSLLTFDRACCFLSRFCLMHEIHDTPLPVLCSFGMHFPRVLS